MSIATRPAWLVYAKREGVAADLVERLHVRYPRDRYALLEQVRDGPGFSAAGAGDLMAVGLWPSRGCEVEGFEVKVSRADWLRELRAPAKAENLFAFCDRWWLVVPAAKDVLREGELPPTWGCIECHGAGKLRAHVEAPRLAPQPMDRHFLAALMKRAVDEPVRRARLAEAYAAGKRDGERLGRTVGNDVEEMARQATRVERVAERMRRELDYAVDRAHRAAEALTRAKPGGEA